MLSPRLLPGDDRPRVTWSTARPRAGVPPIAPPAGPDSGSPVSIVSPTSLSYGSPDPSVNLAAVEDLLAAVRAELPAGGKQYFGTFPSEVCLGEEAAPLVDLLSGTPATSRITLDPAGAAVLVPA